MDEEYKQYLSSWQWEDKKSCILNEINFCQCCGSKNLLEIHHKHYNNIGLERLEDVLVLCRSCHQFFHDFINHNNLDVNDSNNKKIYKLFFAKRKCDLE